MEHQRADGRSDAASPRHRWTSGARRCCARAGERGLLSARGQHRVLRVARTIADLDASAAVRARDLGTAIALRGDAGIAGRRAA